ncbi:TonB-dependent hemoglobin/transferrin/lactoferrin family receptor [Neisseria musculi]|uniref:TonB-dependent heme/hemoglobin receptor family protein n=1 Tax=Neisseria musculi TaxID=1815583 RepID=A0ACD0ZJ91_9NEIS|nr:TonB-dependent hemoglobin/transferrin/lactoferrin family receptor [Neisseria musculi]
MKNMKLKPSVCAVVLAFAAPALYAETLRPETAELETITVTADRNAQKLDRSAPNVAVVPRQTLNQAAAANLDDIFLYEPGVWVPSDHSRRGNAGVNIRGIDGNRILMMVDGVRLPESYAGGGSNGAISGRDLVESDTLRQADIVKGPYSALYGSDALGGVVNLTTYSPADFVDAGKPTHFGLKYGYRSRDRSHGITATAAGYTEHAEGLLMLTRRQGHEIKNKGSIDTHDSSRTRNNPQHNNGYNILAKGSAGNEIHRIEAVFEQFYRKNTTDLLNTLGSSTVVRGPVAVTTVQTQAQADDSARRRRFGLGYRYSGGGRLKEAELSAYRQQLKAQDDAVNVSVTAGNGRAAGSGTRYSDYGFEQTISGINSRAVTEWDTGRLKHTIVAGAEFKHADTGRSRDSITVYSDGRRSKTYAGSLYPNKTFPDSKRRTFSIYAQDSIAFGDSGVMLTPALRYEYEKLKPQIDQAYLNGNPESLPQNFSDSALTPSLRLIWPLGGAFTGFATYSQGFRTPPFDSATMSFSNTQHGYQIVPNNNLKSERSNSFELGMKYKGTNSKAQVTAFYNRYRNFISRQFAGMENGMQIFRFENFDKVKTYGIEAAASHRLDGAWHLNGSIAWMRGREGSGRPLDTAYPPNGVLGVDYVQEKWGAGTKLRWAARQKRASSENHFKTPGYGVWDAGAWYKPAKNIELGVNVYNLGNKKYWQHADVAGMADSGVMDLYSMSGRNIAATAQVKF